MINLDNLKQVRHCIGGSRIAAVAGISPWATPHTVWLEMFGLRDELEVTSDLQRGTHIGPGLVTWYAEKTGMHVSHYGKNEKTFIHPEHKIVCATPDAIVHKTPNSKPLKALEVKAPHWRTADQWGEPGTDMIPEHYLPQVTWECAATQLPVADVAPIIDGDLPIYTVSFSKKLFEALLHVGEKFMKDHVEARKPPNIDASEGARTMLLKIYPHETTDLVEATEADLELLRNYISYGSDIKAWKAEQDAIKNALMERLGEAEGMKTGVANVYWKMRKGKMSWKGFAEDLADEVPDELEEKLRKEHTSEGKRHFQIYPSKKK